MKRIIFLDIDGVLNDHKFDVGAQSSTILRRCVEPFNRLLRETGASVVLSSAWRYMIPGAMTTKGFEYMLRTHGVVGCEIIGVTPRDEEVPTRGEQISKWLAAYEYPRRYIVLDNDAFDIAKCGHELRLTNGEIGLTEEDATAAIEFLKMGASNG